MERSQAEIRKLLLAEGAGSFAFGEEEAGGIRLALMQFEHGGRRVRMRVPLRPIDSGEAQRKHKRARAKTLHEIEVEMSEQEAKRIWRVLAWNLKARLVAVQEGVETFEEAFFSHLVLDTGETMYEAAQAGSLEVGGRAVQLDSPGQPLLGPGS